MTGLEPARGHYVLNPILHLPVSAPTVLHTGVHETVWGASLKLSIGA